MVSTKLRFFPPASLKVSSPDWARRVLMEDRTLDAWSLDMVVTTVSVLRDEEE
jgi:hypothetical protein